MPIRLKYYNDALVINDKINKTKNSRGVAENLDSKLNKKVDELYAQEQCQTLVEVRIVDPDAEGKNKEFTL